MDIEKIKKEKEKLIQQNLFQSEIKIEFSCDNILQQIDNFEQKISDDGILKHIEILNFVNESILYLNNLIKNIINHCQQIQEKHLCKLEEKIFQQNQDYQIHALNLLAQSESQQQLIQEKYKSAILEQSQTQILKNQELPRLPSIGINLDVKWENIFKDLIHVHQTIRNRKFGAIEMDYPWALQFKTQSGKQFLDYPTLTNKDLYNMDIECLQDHGYLFMWVISSKFMEAIIFMGQKGYKIVDNVAWIKKGKRTPYSNKPGYYFRHCKELCLVGLKGNPPEGTQSFSMLDVIESVPGKHSAKPNEFKNIIEGLVPGVDYLEIFGRKNNLRDGWVTIGNEL